MRKKMHHLNVEPFPLTNMQCMMPSVCFQRHKERSNFIGGWIHRDATIWNHMEECLWNMYRLEPHISTSIPSKSYGHCSPKMSLD